MAIEQTSVNLYRQVTNASNVAFLDDILKNAKTIDAYAWFTGDKNGAPFDKAIFSNKARAYFADPRNNFDGKNILDRDVANFSNLFSSDAFKLAPTAYKPMKAACTYGLVDVLGIAAEDYIDTAWARLAGDKQFVTREMLEQFLKTKPV
jgi:hypothetical protein